MGRLLVREGDAGKKRNPICGKGERIVWLGFSLRGCRKPTLLGGNWTKKKKKRGILSFPLRPSKTQPPKDPFRKSRYVSLEKRLPLTSPVGGLQEKTIQVKNPFRIR